MPSFLLKLSMILASLYMIGACASKLPRERKVNSGALGLWADLSMITFTDIDSGAMVNLKDYMLQHNRQHLLLMFGSRGCAVCTKKSLQLRDDYLQKHFLFQDTSLERFELLGVNTDPEHARAQVLRYRDSQSLGFIRWSDPRGDMLAKYFLQSGSPMGVPFTVLVSREGIVWRIDNTEAASVDEILARVAASLGLDGAKTPVPAPASDDSGGEPDAPSLPVVRGIDRFKGVSVKACDGTNLSTELAELPQMKAPVPIRFIQFAHGACGPDCQQNHERMLASCERAAPLAGVNQCMGLTLAETCHSGMYRGGSSLRTQFRSHFDWNDIPVEDDYELRMPDLSLPWVLGFNAEGSLVFSHEGELSETSLSEAMRAAELGESPRGPDFRLYGKLDGEQRFADLRRTSDYTVLITFEKLCASCRDELKHWSTANHLHDYCASRPNACRVLALETTLPFEGSLDAHLAEIDATIQDTGNRLPVYLDPVPYGDDGSGYLNRIFDGYLTARYPGWQNLYGTVIYNEEGLIVADFKGGEPGMADRVFERVKSLVEGE